MRKYIMSKSIFLFVFITALVAVCLGCDAQLDAGIQQLKKLFSLRLKAISIGVAVSCEKQVYIKRNDFYFI